MKFYCLIVLTLMVFLVSCNNVNPRTTTARLDAASLLAKTGGLISQAPVQSLAGKVYFFAPELDSLTGEATGACDCCSSTAVFLSDTTFIFIDHCETNSYITGRYSLKKEKLDLFFDSLSLTQEYNPADDIHKKSGKKTLYHYASAIVKPNAQSYRTMEYQGKLIFKGNNEHGAPDKLTSFNQLVQAMKDAGIWTKLNLL